MTVEKLKQQREQLAKEAEQIRANLIATQGAIQILDKLIAEDMAGASPLPIAL